ncbi:hypothetical protein HN695_05520 [Candidatus Woesearchaeota archaeon]|jgi:hypothetical protein|nr:hypothetical protein [Candidatus Woesearchaeota archaeon]MBT5272197.1 hypothetical protein [Candidatus Woesearchaeota archaeon]MBT6041541.1 hypothetical protein [Candidatus Woesearchaeota archaeon]MBT6336903.1 hypothetical protein [Candidatus Woesearchaeota archaeon]MBT7927773.1 hypothetical protein [Candidatus Woesearchaeota archaeon]
MTEIGIIVNPKAKGNIKDRKLAERLELIVRNDGIVRQTEDISDVPNAVSEFIEAGVKQLVIFGGDGTVQQSITSYLNQVAQINKARLRKAYLENPGKVSETPIMQLPLIYPGNRGTINFTANLVEIKDSPETLISKIVQANYRGETFPTFPVQTLEVRTYPIGKPHDVKSLEYGFVFAAGGVTNFLEKYYGREDSDKVREVSKVLLEKTVDKVPGNEMARHVLYDIIEALFTDRDIERLKKVSKSVIENTIDRLIKVMPVTHPASEYVEKLLDISFDKIARTKRVSEFIDQILEETFKMYPMDRPSVIKAVRVIGRGMGALVLGSIGFPTSYHHEILKPLEATVHVDGEKLPYEQFNALGASAMRIKVIGIDPFYRLQQRNEAGDIHIYAGDMPYVNLAWNFLKTYKPGFTPTLINCFDGVVREITVETKPKKKLLKKETDGEVKYHTVEIVPEIKYSIDAEEKVSAGVIEIRPGPVLRIPQMYSNGDNKTNGLNGLKRLLEN